MLENFALCKISDARFEQDRYPKLSIIMPTYNHERYVVKALDSILMQKVDFKVEIIIGDDCSTDDTAEIVKAYAIKYPDIIIPVCRTVNIGAVANSLDLLARARGEYLATLEGDDFWTSDSKLQQQVNFLESNKEYIACAHKAIIVDQSDRRRRLAKPIWIKYKKTFSLADFGGYFLPGQPSSFVRRNIFLKKPEILSELSTINPFVLDRTLMMTYLSFGNFHCIPKYMGVYRINFSAGSKSLTQTVYGKREGLLRREYDYNCALENEATRLTKKSIIFKQRRRYLCADALIYKLQGRGYDREVMHQLCHDGGLKLFDYVAVLFIMFKKTIYKIVDVLHRRGN